MQVNPSSHGISDSVAPPMSHISHLLANDKLWIGMIRDHTQKFKQEFKQVQDCTTEAIEKYEDCTLICINA